MSETATTVVEPDELPVPDGELRLALAMRGGVSLAVWIGGAAAEVDRMCRAIDERDAYWAWLRRLSGYDAAVVDVMSGASAGGLNAVIASAAMVYDFPLDGLRRLWVEVGALRKMIRRRGCARHDGSDGISLLEGDEYFLAKLDENLRALVESGRNGKAGRARRVDVTLAATLLEPIAVQRVRGMADTTELRYESTFRFRHGGPVRTDFSHEPDARRDAISRLALAGRATSSFPAAFEAAQVHAPRPSTFCARVASRIDGQVSMSGVFGESTATGRVFCVMDGGVLDNIPIARAIDGIVEAPADGPTRRVLVYVQPGSAGVAPDAPTGPPDRSTTAVVSALVRTRVQEETIAVDLRQLDAHNRRARRARLGAVAAIRALEPHPLRAPTDAPADRAIQLLLNRYSAQRSGQETSAITQLLDDPVGTLGHDPFPTLEGRSSVEVDRRWRAPLSEAWETVWAQQLGAALARHLTERISSAISKHGHALTVTAGPLRRLTIMLIDACNAVHRCAATEAQRDGANRLKAALYRVLAVHTELVDRPRRLGWVVLAVQRNDPGETWVDDALTRLDALTADAAALGLDDFLDAESWTPGTSTPLAHADAVMRERLDCLLLDRPLDGEGGVDVRELILDRLAGAAARLAGVTHLDVAGLARLTEQNDLGAGLLAWLRSSPEASQEAWIGRLAALDAATFDPESPDGPGHRPIDFVRLSGANPTPLAAAFPALLGAAVPDDPWADIVVRLQADPPELTDDVKLAGNTLMNFAAFLREHWRENDWMWGRMDAVVTLVDVLVEPARLRRLVAAMPLDPDRLERLQRWFRRAVVEPDGPATSDEWRSFLDAAVWRPRADAIGAALRRAVAEVDGDRDEHGDPVVLSAADLRPLRAALVATRQWQILAELLPPVRDGEGPLDPKTVVERANTYAVGTETVQDPPDPSDRELVQQLAGATRAMLERPATGAVSRATRAGALVVRLLDWLWLDPTDHPRRWGVVLALLGFLGVTIPVALAVDGTANGIVSGAAGIGGLLVVTGAALLVAAGLRIATRTTTFRRGLLLLLAGLVVGVGVAVAGGLVALSVVAAVIAVPILVAGVAISATASVVPRLVGQARRARAGSPTTAHASDRAVA
jgi:patatin-related protein